MHEWIPLSLDDEGERETTLAVTRERLALHRVAHLERRLVVHVVVYGWVGGWMCLLSTYLVHASRPTQSMVWLAAPLLHLLVRLGLVHAPGRRRRHHAHDGEGPKVLLVGATRGRARPTRLRAAARTATWTLLRLLPQPTTRRERKPRGGPGRRLFAGGRNAHHPTRGPPMPFPTQESGGAGGDTRTQKKTEALPCPRGARSLSLGRWVAAAACLKELAKKCTEAAPFGCRQTQQRTRSGHTKPQALCLRQDKPVLVCACPFGFVGVP